MISAGTTTKTVLIGVTTVEPDGYEGTTVSATSIVNPATNRPYSVVSLVFAPSPGLPNQFAYTSSLRPDQPG